MSLDLTSKQRVKALFNQHRIFPSKRLGQNFLIDRFAVKKVVKAAGLTKNDTVLEIGPGAGGLTHELAKLAGQVIACEKDQKMVGALKQLLKCWNVTNVKVVEGDILRLNLKPYKLKAYKVAANLPFYLTAPVIRQFLENENPPKEMILVVQKEVAQRICAKPQKMNLLAVSVQFYGKPQIVSYISRKSFWPEPKVDSAIIKIIPNKSLRRTVLRELFFKVVKAGFSQPRKTLLNNLAKKLNIEKNEVEKILQKDYISLSQRPETLAIEDWRNLAKHFSTF